MLRSLHPLSLSPFLFRSHSSPSSPPQPPSPRQLDLLLRRRLPPPLLSPLQPPPHYLLQRRSPRPFLHSILLITPSLQCLITVAIAFSSLVITLFVSLLFRTTTPSLWIVNSLCLNIVTGRALRLQAAFYLASGVVRFWIPCQGHQNCAS